MYIRYLIYSGIVVLGSHVPPDAQIILFRIMMIFAILIGIYKVIIVSSDNPNGNEHFRSVYGVSLGLVVTSMSIMALKASTDVRLDALILGVSSLIIWGSLISVRQIYYLYNRLQEILVQNGSLKVQLSNNYEQFCEVRKLLKNIKNAAVEAYQGSNKYWYDHVVFSHSCINGNYRFTIKSDYPFNEKRMLYEYVGSSTNPIINDRSYWFYNLYFRYESDKLVSLKDYANFIDAMIGGYIKYTVIDDVVYLAVQLSETEVEVTEYPLNTNNPVNKYSSKDLILRSDIYSLILNE